MSDLKVIIPMAGIGKRMGPLTRHRPKALVRLAGKRLLDHVLATFQELEKTYALEYIFIVGYLGEQIKDHMKHVHPDKVVTYFAQERLMGQSHAVNLAKEVLSGPLFLTYCDTINEVDFSFLSKETMDGVAFIREVDDPRRHGVAFVDSDNLITQLVEKPKTMEHKSALTGFYYFTEGKDLIQAIEAQIQEGTTLNNEYYLADAINLLVADGKRIRIQEALQWLDAGTPEAMLRINAFLLQRQTAEYDTIVTAQSAVLFPPVYMHESARVENSIIGPNVSIGKNCSIRGSIINNSIIDDDSNLSEVTLANSLIGKNSSLTGSPLQSIVADHDQIKIYQTVDQTNGTEQSHRS